MIRTQEMVPDYYIEKSRDFQVLCRILDYLYNSTKYNSESLKNITNTKHAKDTILPLIGDKFGIYDKDAYSTRAMLDALPCALKYKGSLHSVVTLINAFLDSMEIFDFATVYNAKDEDSAEQVSNILNRPVKPYTLVIVLSSYPNLTKLRILDTYLRMVIPSGMFVDYVFGYNKKILDIYKYEDFVILYYTKEIEMTDGNKHQEVSLVRGKNDKYTYDGDLTNSSEFIQNRAVEDSDKLVNSVSIASVENMERYNK